MTDVSGHERGDSWMISDITPAGVGEAILRESERPGALSDEALAARCDAASFTLLYRRHLRPVYSYLYARIGNTQEAEDVTSLAFERAWSGLKSYRPKAEGSFRGWLFTIAHRALADGYRRKDAPSVPIGDRERELLDPARGPEESAMLSEQVRQALKAIEGLGREQQEVVGLRFLGELSYREIAVIVGKREATVKMIAYRALEEIRQRCTDDTEV